MNVGRIGQPRSVPQAPRSDVVAQALNLLAALGGGDKQARHIIIELHAAASHNEAVLAQVAEELKILEDFEERERGLREREDEVDAKLAELQRIRDDFVAYNRDVKAGKYG